MRHIRLGLDRPGRYPLRAIGIAMAGSILLSGCFGGDGGSNDEASADPLTPSNGKLEATIRRTTNGVPHIKANDLSSAAFGAGYAQAEDNVCLLAEAIVKARSERSKYFGPDAKPGSGDNMNVINDFSYKAQDILGGAQRDYDNLSSESRAMIDGFTAGYNKYVADTPASDLPAECRNQPWVKAIEPTDLLAHYRIVGQYASGALFATGAVFAAVPPSGSAMPTPVVTSLDKKSGFDPTKVVDKARLYASERTNYNDMGLASNAWGIGRNMTEQGRGALLANPHFPYTGHRRLYQMQMTVPGYLNVNGAGLLGTAIPLINFNEHLAWSHTVTTSRRFTLYELTLKDGDNLTYIKDGDEKPITSKTLKIEVANGTATPTVLQRKFYYSEYGPMLAADLVTDPTGGGNGLPEWGGTNTQGTTVAYAYRDANANTSGLLDTWLQMSRASNLKEFQDVFRNCGSTLWTNSTYADDQGNAFYIDSSSVPNLSPAALSTIDFKRRYSASYNTLFENGLTLLDGSTSRDDWVEGECNGLVPYEDKPKLLRSDFVQNSNSSYWSTNPDEFLTDYSPLFGEENAPINARTRLGIKMLQNPLDHGLDPNTPAPAGQDGKFSAKDLIGVIWNDRGWYAEQFLGELLDRCTDIGAGNVNVPGSLLPATPSVPGGDSQRSVADGCTALQNWNGTYATDSTGAHTFRTFVDIYMRSFPDDLQTEFDPEDPVYTPADPDPTDKGTADDHMLESLAAALTLLDDAGITYDAKLGDVQYYQPTGGVPPGGDASGVVTQSSKIPWHGGDSIIDGAFNAVGVVNSDFAEDTIIPRYNTPQYEDGNKNRFAAGLSSNSGEGWKIARGTSWHFGLEFTDNGPEAYGLVSYSESSDAMSPHFTDQSERFSDKDYRKLLFTESDIEANLLPQGETTISE